MGSNPSKESTGSAAEATAVNNNIAVSEHSAEKSFDSLIYLLILIAVIKVAEFFLKIYRSHQKNLKKRYAQPV